MQNFSKESLSITEEKLNKFKQLFPEVFSEGKVDFERLKLILGENTSISNERYVLNWADKSEAFTAIQIPTTKTLYPVPEESVKFNSTKNIFIEGENLEVLKILQKSYFGKIKMIYIDPPYNTGSDNFIYPDKFSETKEEYLKKIKEKDEKGYLLKEGLFRKNSKENGQFHSNWLNMMYPRLFLAKNLLKDDGVIFISIDDNEVHNLRLLMNEIFGEENFVSEIVWRKTDNQANIGKIARVKEYILLYTKSIDLLVLNKIVLTEKAKKEYRYNDIKGQFRRAILLNKTRARHFFDVKTPSGNILKGPWMKKESEFYEMEKQNRIHWTKGGEELPYGKIYLKDSDGQLPNDFLSIEFGSNQEASLELESLFNKRYFDFPKSSTLMKHFINIGSNSNDIILDFFAGSGTTAQAVMELNKEDGGNRKFICVQLPEKTEENSEAFKAGYKTIAEISKERIRRAAKKIEAEVKEESSDLSLSGEGREKECPDLGFKVYKLKESNFKIWRSDMVSDEEELKAGIDLFKNPLKDGAKEENVLLELLLKSGYDLNVKVEPIEIDKYKIYCINNNELIVCLEKVSDRIISKILELKPVRCLMLDSLFDGQDSFKTNTVLQLQNAEIDLVVI
uniref:site-specific DNA-methyltransferase (adenine-specific) n=1 Tax=Endomicrobium trichonymphae TaxID=1408204 RepID=A0A1C9ZTL2_ENDTX|nr:type III modification methylase [Candidatus Endomicrobium trichonymphae]